MEKHRKFGLIGKPLKHSFSQKYFTNFFADQGLSNCTYENFELEDISEIQALFQQDIQGINVTIPYKEKVLPYMDELSSEASAIQAVNCIKFENGRKVGYNTDCYGFKQSLMNFYGEHKPESALILGSGGASKAIGYTLQDLKINSRIVSRRNKYLTYDELQEKHFEGRVLIINTTPLGTWPDVEFCPNIPYELISEKHLLYDLVYNPEKTLFLRKGETHGAQVKNGYEMLVLQAEKSWEIWNS